MSDYKKEPTSDNESDKSKHQLFLSQKATLDAFLERGAISKEQYNKSLYDMAIKMGYEKEIE